MYRSIPGFQFKILILTCLLAACASPTAAIPTLMVPIETPQPSLTPPPVPSLAPKSTLEPTATEVTMEAEIAWLDGVVPLKLNENNKQVMIWDTASQTYIKVSVETLSGSTKPLIASEVFADSKLGMVMAVNMDGIPVLVVDGQGETLGLVSKEISFDGRYGGTRQGSNSYIHAADGKNYEWSLETKKWEVQRFVQTTEGVKEWNGTEYVAVVDTVSEALEAAVGYPPLNCTIDLGIEAGDYGAPKDTIFIFPYMKRFQWITTYALAMRWGAQVGILQSGGSDGLNEIRDKGIEVEVLQKFLKTVQDSGGDVVINMYGSPPEGVEVNWTNDQYNATPAFIKKGCSLVLRRSPQVGWVRGDNPGRDDSWGYVDPQTGGVMLGSSNLWLNKEVTGTKLGGISSQWLAYGLAKDIEAWTARNHYEFYGASASGTVKGNPWFVWGQTIKVPYDSWSWSRIPEYLRLLLIGQDQPLGFVGLP